MALVVGGRRASDGPTITNDDVTIAREIDVEDPSENQGAQLVREVGTATNDVAGDGTTTRELYLLSLDDRDTARAQRERQLGRAREEIAKLSGGYDPNPHVRKIGLDAHDAVVVGDHPC